MELKKNKISMKGEIMWLEIKYASYNMEHVVKIEADGGGGINDEIFNPVIRLCMLDKSFPILHFENIEMSSYESCRAPADELREILMVAIRDLGKNESMSLSDIEKIYLKRHDAPDGKSCPANSHFDRDVKLIDGVLQTKEYRCDDRLRPTPPESACISLIEDEFEDTRSENEKLWGTVNLKPEPCPKCSKMMSLERSGSDVWLTCKDCDAKERHPQREQVKKLKDGDN